jgi:hypothetical protein
MQNIILEQEASYAQRVIRLAKHVTQKFARYYLEP